MDINWATVIGVLVGAVGGILGTIVSAFVSYKTVKLGNENIRKNKIFDARIQICVDFINISDAIIKWFNSGKNIEEKNELRKRLESLDYKFKLYFNITITSSYMLLYETFEKEKETDFSNYQIRILASLKSFIGIDELKGK